MRIREILSEKVFDFDPRKDQTLFDLDRAARDGTLDQKQVKLFRQMLSSNPRNDTIRLYHGTTIKHDVWNQGLKPTGSKTRRSLQSGAGYVYVSYDPMRALNFAQMAYPGEGPFVVYSVEIHAQGRSRPAC